MRIKISDKLLFILSISYLLLPILIFVGAWLKAAFSVPFIFVAAGTFAWMIKNFKGEDGIKIKSSYLWFIFIASIFLCVFSGIGEYVWVSWDHAFRRATLYDLIKYDWPVYYDYSKLTDPQMLEVLPAKTMAFSYYCVFWMVPGLIGKLFGFEVANIALVIWSALGLSLVFLGITRFIGKESKLIVAIPMLFSGLEIFAEVYQAKHGVEEWMRYEVFTLYMCYPGNFFSLMNVFNQCIPCWIVVALLLNSKDNKNVGFICALLFPYSPWATIGLIPFAVYYYLKGVNKTNIRNLFSAGNLVLPVIILVVLAPLYLANSYSSSESGFTFTFYPSFLEYIKSYLLFISIEVIPIMLLLLHGYKKNALYWISIVTLLILPFYRIAFNNDLNMRGSIPALFVLTFFFTKIIVDYYNKHSQGAFNPNKKFVMFLLTSFLMCYMFVEMSLLISSNTLSGVEGEKNRIGSFSELDDPLEVPPYFIYDYEDIFFYKYMVRK